MISNRGRSQNFYAANNPLSPNLSGEIVNILSTTLSGSASSIMYLLIMYWGCHGAYLTRNDSEVIRMNHIDRLTALRKARHIKQQEIAALLHCEQAAVSRYESGKSAYSIMDIVRLCEFYHVSADYVLGLPKGLPYPKR